MAVTSFIKLSVFVYQNKFHSCFLVKFFIFYARRLTRSESQGENNGRACKSNTSLMVGCARCEVATKVPCVAARDR